MIENVFEKKKMKKRLWNRDLVTGGPGQKPDWKKVTPSDRQFYGHWRLKRFVTFFEQFRIKFEYLIIIFFYNYLEFQPNFMIWNSDWNYVISDFLLNWDIT